MLWLSGVVIDRTFTSGGVDVRACLFVDHRCVNVFIRIYTEDGGVCWWSGCHISVTDKPLLTPGAPGLIPGCPAAILITSISLYITLYLTLRVRLWQQLYFQCLGRPINWWIKKRQRTEIQNYLASLIFPADTRGQTSGISIITNEHNTCV